MTIDTAKLRELAEKAMPGDWRMSINSTTTYVETTQLDKHGTLHGSVVWIPEDEDDRLSNLAMAQADFIAAANPQTVVALLDRLDALSGIAADAPDWLAELSAKTAEIATMARGYRDLHDMLPGNKDVWSKVDDLKRQLAAMTAARDEACDIGQRHTRALRAIMPKADRIVADDERLSQLRKVGSDV